MKLHVIKCPNNPQGPNVLMNELIGTELMHALGLPTPKWRIATYVPPLSCNSVQGSRLDPKRRSCHLHFGSELVEASDGNRVYCLLPSAYIPLIENRADFIGAMIFDLWAESTDARQAVFVEDRQTKTFRAIFIDQGGLFRGPSGVVDPRSAGALCRNRALYPEHLAKANVEQWVALLRRVIPSVLPSVLAGVPHEWYHGSRVQQEDRLLKRLGLLSDTVSRELKIAGRPWLPVQRPVRKCLASGILL